MAVLTRHSARAWHIGNVICKNMSMTDASVPAQVLQSSKNLKTGKELLVFVALDAWLSWHAGFMCSC